MDSASMSAGVRRSLITRSKSKRRAFYLLENTRELGHGDAIVCRILPILSMARVAADIREHSSIVKIGSRTFGNSLIDNFVAHSFRNQHSREFFGVTSGTRHRRTSR